MSPTELDMRPCVAVVGAGPAGCAAAYELGQVGIKVILLERGLPGKDKTCGDALLPSAVRLLEKYYPDPDWLPSIGGRSYDHIMLLGQQSVFLNQNMAPETGWVVPRSVLDQELRDKVEGHSDVSIWYRTSVLNIEEEADGALRLLINENKSIRNIVCDAVVLATGSRNHMSERFGIDGAPINAAAISTYMAIKAPRELIFQFFNEDHPGYGWIFPVKDELINLGIFVMQPGKYSLRRIAHQFLEKLKFSGSIQWRGGAGPLWSGLGRCWHHTAGIVSCGDAAGLVDPVSGEGISSALMSGKQGGKAIASYILNHKQAAHLKDYSRWVRNYFSLSYGNSPTRELWTSHMG